MKPQKLSNKHSTIFTVPSCVYICNISRNDNLPEKNEHSKSNHSPTLPLFNKRQKLRIELNLFIKSVRLMSRKWSPQALQNQESWALIQTVRNF